MPMSLDHNKPGRSSQRAAAIFRAATGRKDFSNLTLAVQSRPLFQPGSRRRRARGADDNLDRAFQGLLKEANRELAGLLRDVRNGSDPALLDGAGSQAIRDLLRRALQCATKQYMLQTELGNLALKDELTGLYNRRGFLALADRQLKLARRSGRSLLLFFIDVDGLKEINDVFGHAEGDASLKRMAEALEMTFRDSDVIARWGGDEFAILAIEASGQSASAIRDRLAEYLNSANHRDSSYEFSVSLGTARFDPWRPASIRELIAEADQAMYEQKRSRSTARANAAAGYKALNSSSRSMETP
jgi:diguanylate cyclase (GGDEF)-like protein